MQLAALIVCLLGVPACRPEDRAPSQGRTQRGEAAEEQLGPRQKAQAIWKTHESVLRAVFDGKRVSGTDLASACDFFFQLTGIKISTDFTYIGMVVTRHADKDFEKVRRWHEVNWPRLYWSSENNSVTLQPRLSSDTTPEKRRLQEHAASVWREKEYAVLRACYGLSDSPKEFRQAWSFFADLTGIELPANKTSAGVAPNDQTITGLEALNDWFGLNHNEIYWDEKEQSVRLKAGGKVD